MWQCAQGSQNWAHFGLSNCRRDIPHQGSVPIYSPNDLLANKVNNQEKSLEYYLLLNSIFLLVNYKSFITQI